MRESRVGGKGKYVRQTILVIDKTHNNEMQDN